MTGKQNGVAALLRKEHPGIINIHCICYKLALACADTKTELKDIDLAVDFAAIMEVFSKFSEKNFGLPESAGRYEKSKAESKFQKSGCKETEKGMYNMLAVFRLVS